MNIGKTIKELREERDYSLVQLSALSGVSYAQLYRYEHGEFNPTAHNLVKIAKALDVGVERLMA